MVFHVLNRGVARMQLFEKTADYQAFEQVLRDTLDQSPMRICAYAVMPNHWHLLLWPECDGELAAFMQRLTITHVRRWQEHKGYAGLGHVYQGRYKSFPVESDEHFWVVAVSESDFVFGFSSPSRNQEQSLTPWSRCPGGGRALGMDLYFTALIQLLAAHAQNTRNFQKAAHLFERLATSGKYHGDAKIEASAYHQLGMIAQEQRDLAGAEQWYCKAMARATRRVRLCSWFLHAVFETKNKV